MNENEGPCRIEGRMRLYNIQLDDEDLVACSRVKTLSS